MIDDYDIDAIGFEDELTAANDKRIVDICHAIRSGVKRDLTYRITTRVDLFLNLKDETVKLMRDTGFVGANYGVESGSQRVLDYMQKDITLKQVLEVDDRLNKFGFFKSFNFMLGLPTETIDEKAKADDKDQSAKGPDAKEKMSDKKEKVSDKKEKAPDKKVETTKKNK